MIDPREDAFVRAFIQKEKRARTLYLLGDPHRRGTFLSMLDHFRWFDPKFLVKISRSELEVSQICEVLRGKGAGKEVHAISSDRGIDGMELELEAAIEMVRGSGMGTVVLCSPGLALYEGEDKSLILERG